MKLFELHDALVITERRINDIHTIKAKIESQLHAMKARTIKTDREITFKTIPNILPWGYIDLYPTLLRIYKDGSIVIEKHKNSLEIKWTVKLDTLFFIASFSSLIFGIIIHFTMSLEFVYTIFASIGFFLIFLFLGILYIKYKITDMIESSVYPN